MIVDSATDVLYLSALLANRQQFFASLTATIERRQISYRLLPNTKDIWAVDYMPIQVGFNNYVQFVYEPDYLQNRKYRSLQTDTTSVCNAIGVAAIKSDIKLDGGNVIKGTSWVIVTEKVFKENPNYSKGYIVEELERLFDVRVIIIPQQPYDYTGHADGIVRYYDDHTVLISSDDGTNTNFINRLKKVLRSHHLSWVEILNNTSLNSNYDMADGMYINFLQMKDFILLPTFNSAQDELAYNQFCELYPNTSIETIDAREISIDGGVLNCISWNVKI